MMNTVRILPAVLLTAAATVFAADYYTTWSVAPEETLVVAERLAVDTHAELLVGVNAGHAINIYNCGTIWGSFGNFGLDGPLSSYPLLDDIDDNSECSILIFDGNDHLSMDVPTSAHRTDLPPFNIADGTFTIEVWARNPSVGAKECLLSWKALSGDSLGLGFGSDPSAGAIMHSNGKEAGYPAGQVPAAGVWQHIVLTYDNGTERLYVNTNLVLQRSVTLSTDAEGTLYIGCDANGENYFSGDIAAIRIHEGVMTGSQIIHNYSGGPMLGTKLHPNVFMQDPRGATFIEVGYTGVEEYFSEHFRHGWFSADVPSESERNNILGRLNNMFDLAEACFEDYTKKLAMHVPIVSFNPQYRTGDGKKYQVAICANWGGGNYGGASAHGFGYPIQYPGYINPHEFGHATQYHSMGQFMGNWYEAHANWVTVQTGRPQNHPKLYALTAPFYAGSGRHYYHCNLFLVHLSEYTETGPPLIAKMWHNNPSPDINQFILGKQILSNSSLHLELETEWAKMARKAVTWKDYTTDDNFSAGDKFTTANDDPEMYRYGRIVLEPIRHESPGWYRVPNDMAPQQFGWNICPLEPTATSISIDFQGYVNPARGSAWRASIVAVNTSGESRYSDVWASGVMNFTLNGDENELYLVVVATPSNFMEIGTTENFKTAKGHKFPYKVKLTGAVPLCPIEYDVTGISFSRHPNGGGRVQNAGNVDAAAYVGTNALVLGNAQVRDTARVEDYACIRDNAVVRGNAIVSGYALVENSSIVEGYARVRDYAKLNANGSVIRDHVRLLEHATIDAASKTIKAYVTVKGWPYANGDMSGTTIIDGNYNKGDIQDKGVWFNWAWGSGHSEGEIDKELNGLYAQYLFETEHPYLVWDTYSANHGFKQGVEFVEYPGRYAEKVLYAETELWARPGGSYDRADWESYLAAQPVTGRVARFNGSDQFIEIPRDIGDMFDFSVELNMKWDGGAADQKLFQFPGKDGVSEMYFTPSDASGKMALVITANGSTQKIIADRGATVGSWQKITVTIYGGKGRIFLTDTVIGENLTLTLRPEDVRPQTGYIGRGQDGHYYDGELEDIGFYSIAVLEDEPPTPNPPEWALEPTILSENAIIMAAVKGSDAHAPVEYKFLELSGNAGGQGSSWQADYGHRNLGLSPERTYRYAILMRDALGNVTATSTPFMITTPTDAPDCFLQDPDTHLLSIEAEHYDHTEAMNNHHWDKVTSPSGYSGSGMMRANPDQGVQVNKEYEFNSPRLDFRVYFTQAGRHYIWVRGYGNNYGGDSCHVGLDYRENTTADYIGMTPGSYQWNSDRKYIDVPYAGIHVVNIWMREDGYGADKIVLTPDSTYLPEDTGPDESVRVTGGLDTTPPEPDPASWSAPPSALNDMEIAMTATTATDPAGVEYYFECTADGGHDSGWQDSSSYTDTGLEDLTEFSYRVRARDKSLFRNATGWSPEQSATTEMADVKITQEQGATDVTESSATLNGVLEYATAHPTEIYVYLGRTNAGTDRDAWEQEIPLGVIPEGSFSTAVTGLLPETTYYYRGFGTNEQGTGWSLSAKPFYTTTTSKEWNRIMMITFSGYDRATVLTNFPVLVVLNDNIEGFSYTHFGSANGTDLRFEDKSGTEVPYEIESWNPQGSSYIWVQVPELASAETFIIARWGNGDALQPAYTTNGATWSEGYAGVWHMNEPGAVNSVNGHAGTAHGNQNAIGYIGGAQSFSRVSGNQYISVGDIDISDDLTMEAWLCNTYSNPPGDKFVMSKKDSYEWYQWNVDWNINFDIIGTSRYVFQKNNMYDLDEPAWTYEAVSYDSSEGFGKGYMTTQADPNTMAQRYVFDKGAGMAPAQNNNELTISCGDNRGYYGRMDEVRLSRVERSADWLWASWKSQGGPDEFAEYGAVQLIPEPGVLLPGLMLGWLLALRRKHSA